MTSGTTSQRLGVLPLVIGMPVMITSNFDMQVGIVNGATGILDHVCYKCDKDGRHYALSCIVSLVSMSSPSLSGLQKNQVVALPDSVDLIFRH
ncbi:hypothetical protein ARMGADRAFT_939946, partial [Armillaria gallica]